MASLDLSSIEHPNTVQPDFEGIDRAIKRAKLVSPALPSLQQMAGSNSFLQGMAGILTTFLKAPGNMICDSAIRDSLYFIICSYVHELLKTSSAPQIESLQHDKRTLSETNSALVLQLIAANSQIDSMSKRLSEFEQLKETYESKLEAQKAKIAKIKSSPIRQVNSNTQIQSREPARVPEFEMILNVQRAENREQAQKIARLIEQNDKLEKELSQRNHAISELQNEVHKLQETVSSSDHTMKEIKKVLSKSFKGEAESIPEFVKTLAKKASETKKLRRLVNHMNNFMMDLAHSQIIDDEWTISDTKIANSLELSAGKVDSFLKKHEIKVEKPLTTESIVMNSLVVKCCEEHCKKSSILRSIQNDMKNHVKLDDLHDYIISFDNFVASAMSIIGYDEPKTALPVILERLRDPESQKVVLLNDKIQKLEAKMRKRADLVKLAQNEARLLDQNVQLLTQSSVSCDAHTRFLLNLNDSFQGSVTIPDVTESSLLSAVDQLVRKVQGYETELQELQKKYMNSLQKGFHG